MTDVVTASSDQQLVNTPMDDELHQYRGELTGYCYRMLGSAFDAEDAVQETMVRAWRAKDRFEGRSALRSWLYRIATNVCLDSLDSRKRRARPMDLSASPWQPVESSLEARLPEATWVEPILDGQVLPAQGDPAELAVARESIRLAFIAALQYLPPRQRVVLILRDVLRWKAAEVAELLETTVASANSALQRARATMAARQGTDGRPEPMDPDAEALLTRYIDAFERYDIDLFVTLLHEDATQNMPPFEMWLQGRDNIGAWMLGPGIGCRGSRLIRLSANDAPAFASYKPNGADRLEPWGIHVLDIRGDRIAGISSFLDTRLFAHFGLPETLAPAD